MPELPDISVYIKAIESRGLNRPLRAARVQAPFLLRTVEPPITDFRDRTLVAVERMGKRIVLGFDDSSQADGSARSWMVIHLMIAGRLHWKPCSAKPPGKSALLVLEFDDGWLYLTEAGSKRRASLHLFDDVTAMDALNPHGLEVLDCSFEEFDSALTRRNHTLKRALTDPHIFSGIGNAYSDEILHHAKLSPIAMSQKLDSSERQRLFEATREVLEMWVQRLFDFYGDKFPEKVTAFRNDMAAHGRFGQPCPICAAPIQRIRYATNETNYCAACQTGGKLLADRALSRLLKKDWPRTLDELERKKS